MKFSLPIVVAKTLKALQDAGFEAYVVGGAVRDLLTDNPVTDWDFTTDAQPKQIQKIFSESFYDNQFGTVGITVEELVNQFGLKNVDYSALGLEPEHVLEITTFRTEHGYSDRRRPDKVTWGKTLEEDLTRRDFTINAMALKVISPQFPVNSKHDSKKLSTENCQLKTEVTIIDPFTGRKDLERQIIRAVGNPQQRFDEDALRMMRAIRFAAQLGFTIERKTSVAIAENATYLQAISQERIRDELFKILASPYPADGVKLLFTSGLLQFILPELVPMRGVDQAGHHTKDVWNHSLDALAACPSPDPIIRLATLLHDVGKPVAFRKQGNKITFYGHEVVGGRMAKKIAERLHLSKKETELLWKLVRYHMFAYDPKMTDAAIRRFIRRVGREHINEMMMMRVGDRVGGGSKATSWRLRELQERIGQVLYTPMQLSDLKVSGHDVMKTLKIRPGPRVGKILKQLFEEVLEDAAKNDREHLLSQIKELGKTLKQ